MKVDHYLSFDDDGEAKAEIINIANPFKNQQ